MQTIRGKGRPLKEEDDARIIFYARVSTEDQNLDMQVQAARRIGVRDEDIFVEKLSAVSRRRPQLKRAMMRLHPGDTFAVWRLDRLARGVERRLRDTDATVKELAVWYKISATLIHKRFAGGKKALQAKRRRKSRR